MAQSGAVGLSVKKQRPTRLRVREGDLETMVLFAGERIDVIR
jgi:hypothetical protein